MPISAGLAELQNEQVGTGTASCTGAAMFPAPEVDGWLVRLASEMSLALAFGSVVQAGIGSHLVYPGSNLLTGHIGRRSPVHAFGWR